MRVDLPRQQPLDQGLGRDVDQDDLVGRAYDGVGHRLPDARAGQLGDLVVEALEMLDVDGREHVDPGGEHVLHVLPALFVLQTRRVCMGELVDQTKLGAPTQNRGQVHLLEDRFPVGDAPARNQLQSLRLGDRLDPPVWLQVANHDVCPVLGVGLALT